MAYDDERGGASDREDQARRGRGREEWGREGGGYGRDMGYGRDRTGRGRDAARGSERTGEERDFSDRDYGAYRGGVSGGYGADEYRGRSDRDEYERGARERGRSGYGGRDRNVDRDAGRGDYSADADQEGYDRAFGPESEWGAGYGGGYGRSGEYGDAGGGGTWGRGARSGVGPGWGADRDRYSGSAAGDMNDESAPRGNRNRGRDTGDMGRDRSGGMRGERGYAGGSGGYGGTSGYAGARGGSSEQPGPDAFGPFQGDVGYGGYGYGTGYGTDLGARGRGNHAGRGPKNYRRSDERIEEEINEALTRHPDIDASDIEVRVQNGEVTLSGTVDDRSAKRLAEDLAESASGVSNVNNQIRVNRGGSGHQQRTQNARSDREVTRTASHEGTAQNRAGAAPSAGAEGSAERNSMQAEGGQTE